MNYIIETNSLVKQYKAKLAVDNVSIHVERGDIYGLIGKNGAGKTTLLKLILGLSTPTNGNTTIFGSTNLDEGRTKIGSLIEAPGLYKNCTAYENMLRFSILYGTDKNEITPLLKKVGLDNTGKKKVREFSLGMRQRLGIAIALLGNPEILILDEPINGLDPAGIKDIRNIILELNKEGVTFVISSHLLDELAKIVTKYGIISNGQLIEEVGAHELQESCTHSAKIVSDDNRKVVTLLKEKFIGIKVELKDTYVLLTSHLDETAMINSYLVNSGISISELSLTNSSYEDYFIERLGR